jgi:hypothetical protein
MEIPMKINWNCLMQTPLFFGTLVNADPSYFLELLNADPSIFWNIGFSLSRYFFSRVWWDILSESNKQRSISAILSPKYHTNTAHYEGSSSGACGSESTQTKPTLDRLLVSPPPPTTSTTPAGADLRESERASERERERLRE